MVISLRFSHMGCMTLNQYGQCYLSKKFGVGPWTFLYCKEDFMSLPSNHCMLSFIHLTLQQSIILPILCPQPFSIQAFACLILQLGRVGHCFAWHVQVCLVFVSILQLKNYKYVSICHAHKCIVILVCGNICDN